MRIAVLVLVAFPFSKLSADERPNILWLTCEDNNVNWVGCYGNPHADTPGIDALAAEGFQYMHCYANAPVCAPSRSTWITGVHAVSMGTHPMRSRYPIPHDRIRYYPDLLKEAGYYVGNAGKTDYNIGGRDDKEPWDTNKLDWDKLQQRQPFFMVVNSTLSHESKAFGDVTGSVHSPSDVRLAEYHPDIPEIRQNYAHYHDQVRKMDAAISKSLADLKASGLAENTIVVHNSDHGGVIARSKRFLFNSGTHCPLIIRIPEKFKALRPGPPGTKVNDLVSFIDMPKTWLSICGAKTPEYLQGRIFLGADKESRDYHVSFRTRMDERCDNVRAIRDDRFLLIRNYMPYAPWGQHLNYLWNMAATKAWEKHHREGLTNAVTGRFFGTKPMLELYDTSVDPDNVRNLIDDPNYSSDVERLSNALDKWQQDQFDSGLIPESEMVRLSEESGKTIYEVARDPQLYDLKRIQLISNLALEQNPSNLSVFYNELGRARAALRYWGMVGLFLLQEKADLDLKFVREFLADDCHHVRIMAAWILYRAGDEEEARQCWNDLLSQSSYASLKVFNVIDWIGAGHEPYLEAMKSCSFSHEGYVSRMQEYMGVKEPVAKKKKAGRRKK